MNALCTSLCKEHHRYLCLNVIFLVFSEISCDISYMSVAREARSGTGGFPPSLYLQPALLFFLAKTHWLPRVADSLQENDFTFLTNHTCRTFFPPLLSLNLHIKHLLSYGVNTKNLLVTSCCFLLLSFFLSHIIIVIQRLI